MTRTLIRKRNKDLFFDLFSSQDSVILNQSFIPNVGAQSQLFFDILNCLQNEDRSVISQEYQNQYSAIYFRAGIGSGKTFSGGAFCVTRSDIYPNAIGLISANSYPQLRDSTLRGLARFCHDYNIELKPSGGDYKETARKIAHNQYCTINGVWHDVKSADAFAGKTEGSSESGRGTEYAWAWLDEYAYAPQSAFETIQGRMRWAGINPHILITSTINRNNPYNWCYDLFDDEDRDELKRKLFISISGSTEENKHNLSDGYIERLQATLSPELYAIEVKSEYVAISIGRIFKYFNRQLHSKQTAINYNYPLHFSFDFNWSPACCVVGQKINDKLIILKEFYLENADTFILIDTVLKWLKSLNFHREIFIHGDASGSQKTANSKTTNWKIIWDALNRENIIATRQYKKANPSIIDSANACNSTLSHDKCDIDLSCKELIKDLESLQWKNDQIDKSDIKRSHLADCFRYLVWDIFPYANTVKFKQGVWEG